MNRRGFFGGLVGLVAGLFGVAAAKPPYQTMASKPWKWSRDGMKKLYPPPYGYWCATEMTNSVPVTLCYPDGRQVIHTVNIPVTGVVWRQTNGQA